MGHGHEVMDELGTQYRQLRELVPDVLACYGELHRAAMADGAISAVHKELIALAIAISRECDGCIAAHARGAVRRGATRIQVAETVGVAILMNGGPGTVFGPRALAAFDEYAAAAANGTTRR